VSAQFLEIPEDRAEIYAEAMAPKVLRYLTPPMGPPLDAVEREQYLTLQLARAYTEGMLDGFARARAVPLDHTFGAGRE